MGTPEFGFSRKSTAVAALESYYTSTARLSIISFAFPAFLTSFDRFLLALQNALINDYTPRI